MYEAASRLDRSWSMQRRSNLNKDNVRGIWNAIKLCAEN